VHKVKNTAHLESDAGGHTWRCDPLERIQNTPLWWVWSLSTWPQPHCRLYYPSLCTRCVRAYWTPHCCATRLTPPAHVCVWVGAGGRGGLCEPVAGEDVSTLTSTYAHTYTNAHTHGKAKIQTPCSTRYFSKGPAVFIWNGVSVALQRVRGNLIRLYLNKLCNIFTHLLRHDFAAGGGSSIDIP